MIKSNHVGVGVVLLSHHKLIVQVQSSSNQQVKDAMVNAAQRVAATVNLLPPPVI
eukprot:SAG11_NODE_21692_length_420_cov_0.959502_1_plen_54_part_01